MCDAGLLFIARSRKKKKNTAIKATTTANVYEALKSAERRGEVEEYCKEDELVSYAVGELLKAVLKNGFEYNPDKSLSLEDIEHGLSQFRESPPSFVSLDDRARKWLLKLNRICPAGIGNTEG